MFEVKLGKMMFRETFRGNKLNMNLYEKISIEDFSNKDFAEAGKEFLNNIDLFISFMDYINMDSNIETNETKDYSSLLSDSMLKVFTIVDNIVASKQEYYFDTTDGVYESVYSVNNKDLGFKCWEHINKFKSYQSIKEHPSINNDKFFTEIAINLQNKGLVLNSFENYSIGSEEDLSDEAVRNIIRSTNKAIMNKSIFAFSHDAIWSLKDNYSSKELGKLCWEFVYNDYSRFVSLSKDEIQFIESNFELMWDKIDEKEKDSIKQYILNIDIDNFLTYSKVEDEISKAIDKVLLEEYSLKSV